MTEDEARSKFWDSWSFNAKWKEILDRKFSYKALGMSEDDGVNVRNGIGWKELAVITVAFTAFAAWQNGQPTPANQQPAQQPIIIQQPAQQPEPIERTETITTVREFDFRIRDQDGNIIAVSPWRGEVSNEDH